MSKIAGMLIVAERSHNKYCSVILIRDDLNVDNVYERIQGTVELITILMPEVVVYNLCTSYQPTRLSYQPLATEIIHTL